MLFKLSLYSVIFTIIQSYKIDYILTYSGNTSTNTGPSMRFAGAFTSSNIIQSYSNISECISNCTDNYLVMGILFIMRLVMNCIILMDMLIRI